MKVEVEQLSPIERKLVIEVPWEKVQEELDAAYRGLAKRARIKGFRAGKVPRNVLEKFYRTTVEGEVVNRLVDETYRQAVSDQSLVPIAAPRLDAMPSVAVDEPLRFVATVEVKPEVEVRTYTGLPIERKMRDVLPNEVEAELNTLRERAVVVEQITDRKDAQARDLAVIDFFGYVNGETFKGGKGISYTVEIGAGRMIAGFEDQLVGMKIGDQKIFHLGFPKGEGPEEVRGKVVEWKVDLKELKRKILPDLDDEFAKDLGEYDTLEELKVKIRENLSTREDARSRKALRDAVMSKLVAENPVDVPPRMIDRQLDFLLQDAERAVRNAKDVKLDGLIERLREEARPKAREQVAGMLLLEAVAKAEKIEVSDADLDARIQDLARQHRMGLKQLRQQLKENQQLESIRYDIMQDRTLDRVLELALVTERRMSAEEIAAEDAKSEGVEAALGASSEASEAGDDPIGYGGGEAGHVHGPNCAHD